MADIKAYQISIKDSDISDLKDRLSRARFPDELEAAAWDLGTPLGDVKRLTQHWAETFDWRRAEAELNKFPQFTTPVQADGFEPLELHFIHQRSEAANAIPLLFVHGWPGSFLEGTKIIRPLAEGGDGHPAFHVVVPSLANYGFSEGTKKRGFSIDQHAEVLNQLMLKLGYGEYVTQGGDWGWAITRAMAKNYPQHSKAQHFNIAPARPPPFLKHPLLAIQSAVTPWTEQEKQAMGRTQWFMKEGNGYGQVHSTKPQTLGYALSDSPVALLGWIYEKLRDWTDAYPWTDDEILTWISIYWFSTAGPAASIRLYYENRHDTDAAGAEAWTRLMEWQNSKVGLGIFPKDIFMPPKPWTHQLGKVIYQKNHRSGGHFAAWERPEAIIGDLREMFGEKGGARGAVKESRL
ncbi:hypothetical protein JX265_004523 [Neoarthrinium moseri]|uniref:Epoxide hydrolase N-terminal domain-containing protein n=1 Tax=Neoarthrinium moseri TaxID=1658444 RepID=A0A9P9WR04_9PEZI|nr:hypothetical protein JX265_004523 [Neoarthrinium moseri]